MGAHRSTRRGSGIEFDSHRDYTPGDDLRRLDHRALMRHGKLLVRQFETETERCLSLLLDATPSMAYKSPKAPGAKLAYAALLGAALAKVALAGADTVSLDWLGAGTQLGMRRTGGGSALARLLDILEHSQADGPEPESVDSLRVQLGTLAQRAQRGSLVVFLSDLVDLPEDTETAIATLAMPQRRVITIQVLDPVEALFPFDGAVRLKSSSGDTVIETDGATARAGYLSALQAQQERWQSTLQRFGGSLICCTTADPAINVVREVLRAAGRLPA
jgi:uncharacterized protein (DUF58 family)